MQQDLLSLPFDKVIYSQCKLLSLTKTHVADTCKEALRWEDACLQAVSSGQRSGSFPNSSIASSSVLLRSAGSPEIHVHLKVRGLRRKGDGCSLQQMPAVSLLPLPGSRHRGIPLRMLVPYSARHSYQDSKHYSKLPFSLLRVLSQGIFPCRHYEALLPWSGE